MIQIRADAALREALTRNGARVEIVDDSGKLIGLAHSLKSVYLEEGQDPYDPDEVRAALANPRRYTTDEFIAKLGLE